MPDPFSNETKAAMFFAGLIMLTPHRIAMTCAPHILKRFYLTPTVVSLFIYKIHNPMELSSLISTLLVNMITWMNDATFKYKIINRALSILGVWLMFISSVISFIIFISGGDFGYFNQFYWSIILITFTNGIFSNLSFGVNYNTSLYGAGVPSSGFVTFFVHYIYKGLYSHFHWDDYDYKLVIVQYLFTVILLFAASILWTADQVMQMLPEDDRTDNLNNPDQSNADSVVIDIEKRSIAYDKGTGSDINESNIAEDNIKVFLEKNKPAFPYTCYKHKVYHSSTKYKKMTNPTFKNGGNELSGISDLPNEVEAVFVFYFGAMDIPIIIGVKDASGSLHKYFKKKYPFLKWGDNWTNITGNGTGKISGNKGPDDATNNELKNELDKLTGELILACIGIMISIIFVSVMIGVITSCFSSKFYGIPVALIVYTAVTIILSRDAGIGELFTKPEHLSPVLMLAFSLGTVYAFYPSISPYSLVDPDSGKTIDLWIQFVSTLPTYAIAVMDTVGDQGKGPGGMGKENNWTERKWWHYQWFFAIPYILCIHIFIRTLHFPDGWIGRRVKNNIWVAGIVGNIFNVVQEWLEAIGFAGGGKQGNIFFNSAVSQFNGLMFLTTCMITMFTSSDSNFLIIIITSNHLWYFHTTYF